MQVDLSSTDVGPQVVRAYLSRQHFEDVENSCPMVALPTGVARSGAVLPYNLGTLPSLLSFQARKQSFGIPAIDRFPVVLRKTSIRDQAIVSEFVNSDGRVAAIQNLRNRDDIF